LLKIQAAKLNFLLQFAFEMAKNKDIGEKGEALAAEFLVRNGYKELAKNYRHRRNEIDLIVEKDGVLVFVEVKLRKNNAFGFPESFVDEAKISRLKICAEQYLVEKNWNGPIRFDILSITGEIDNRLTISHFEDAF
jgi:putative endonuclease